MSRVLADLTELRRFSFAEKLELAYLIGMGVTDAVLIPSIKRFNKIRNQVAHSFVAGSGGSSTRCCASKFR